MGNINMIILLTPLFQCFAMEVFPFSFSINPENNGTKIAWEAPVIIATSGKGIKPLE